VSVATDHARTLASRLRAVAPGASVAAAAGAGGVAGSYAAVGFRPSFVAAPVSRVVVDATPAVVVRYSILLLGDVGSAVALGLSLAATALLVAVAVAAGRALAGRSGAPVPGPLAGGLGALALAAVLAGDPLSAVGAALGATAPLAAVSLVSVPGGGTPEGRRATLAGLATAVGVGVAGVLLGGRGPGGALGSGTGGSGRSASDPLDEQAASAAERRLLSAAAERSLDAAGLEPLVSDSFYTVDIAQVDPSPDPEAWTLTVSGAVEEETTYSFDDVTSRDARHQFVSLRCVGESLNGRKMDTALWTGVALRPLVAAAGVVDDSCCVVFRAADGYYEEFPLDALEGSLLAYRMNGDALPRGHGAPARALIPGHWGEINVKWLTEVELKRTETKGYWEERGWHGTGPVNTVAKLHVTNRLDDGRIEVGGHAYAGTRGVDRVEVSTDGGETWTDATLSERLPAAVPAAESDPDVGGEAVDAWRQWVHRYDPPAGSHEVVVRATDGTGTLQPRTREDAFPSGPSGWVSKSVDP
jgi:DMSO/TMAO reductase YedYZ molybdopterin-dependent catalytic subunit